MRHRRQTTRPAPKATFARKGSAYRTTCTFNFNDRENSTKSLQFQGSGPLQTVSRKRGHWRSSHWEATPRVSYVRLFLGSDNTAAPSTVIAAAKSLSLHVSLTWKTQRPRTPLATGRFRSRRHSLTTSRLAHVRSGETITSQVGAKSLARNHLRGWYTGEVEDCNVGGDNNRTASSTDRQRQCCPPDAYRQRSKQTECRLYCATRLRRLSGSCVISHQGRSSAIASFRWQAGGRFLLIELNPKKMRKIEIFRSRG